MENATDATLPARAALGVLAGGGEMARLIGEFDWSSTPLGSVDSWTAPLRTTVGLILRSPIPIVTLWGEAGTMIYNDAYSVFAGGRHPKLLGSAVREGWPEVADFNDNVMKVVFHGGGTLSYVGQQLTLYRPGVPEEVWLNLDYSPLIDEAGHPIGVIAIVVETTEAVSAAQALREREQTFRTELERQVAERTAALAKSEESIRAIFQTSHLSQSLVSTDGILRFANATALAAIGAAPADVIGRLYWETPWFAKTPGASDQVRKAMAEAASGHPASFSTTLILPGGARSFDVSVRPVKDESGAVVGLVPEAIDITARIRAEQALQQAQKVEAIGNLTGGIAHDFNNLLMAVLGSLELLRKRMPEDPALLRLVDTATEGARRGKSLTARMLAFARRQDLKTERIDVGRLVNDMSELMMRSLGPMITLDIRIDPDLPQIEADANQLEAALLNLAVNARDAMHGEGPITITARSADGDAPALAAGRYVCLAVADKGEGMDAETLKRATEPFFTTKGVGKGTGLGLSMVHGLAEQSGGTLLLRSRPGEGTVAEIWLPATTSVETEAPAPAPAPEPERDTPRLCVLAVDDDALILMNTVAMLEDLGHEVVSASSGKQALERLGARRFDMLVTDQAMPHMTGLQLIAAAAERDPAMAVVLATGYAEIPSEAGATLQRLSKPFSQAELSAAVAASMARARGV